MMLDISPLKLDFIMVAAIVLLLAGIIYNHRRSTSAARNGAVTLGVQDLIEKVKDELIAIDLKRIRENKAAMFEVRDFDLDISFVVSQSTSASGGLEFRVVTLEGEVDSKSEKAQRIRLHMAAVPNQVRKEAASASPLTADENTIDMQPPPQKIPKDKN